MKDNVDSFEETLTELTRNHLHKAAVELPAEHELKVRLVRTEIVERFLEYQEDYQLYISAVFIVLGSVLGFILNSFTSEIKWDSKMSILCILVFLLLIFLVYRAGRIRKKYKSYKKRILQVG